jgi:hypothetical protein
VTDRCFLLQNYEPPLFEEGNAHGLAAAFAYYLYGQDNGHTGNRVQRKRDGKVGAPSPCHPFRSATNRQFLFMPPRPFLMPSNAHLAQGIVKNVNPFSTKKLGSMSGGMKYMPGTTP